MSVRPAPLRLGSPLMGQSKTDMWVSAVSVPDRHVPRASRLHPFSPTSRGMALLGLGYLAGTLACSVWYCILLQPSMTNDLYWPHYNTTGYQAFLVDILNVKLQTLSNGSVDLFAADAALPKCYASATTQPDFYNNYARRVLYTEMNTLAKAIQGMRSTGKSRLASAYAQYCWVDFERRWDIAHTDGRARRCLERYVDNAANYVEFVLRNVDWTVFQRANSAAWPIVIGQALEATLDGAQWLADRPKYAQKLSVADEVAYLEAHQLTRYELQWQNEVQMGHTESVGLRNILNVEQTMALKTMDHVWGPWTSINMFANFRNDMGNLAILNLSLVRNASNYFQVQGYVFSNQLGLQDTNGVYNEQPGAFYSTIGPFGGVDLLYVQLPLRLITLHSAFAQSLDLYFSGTPNALTTFEDFPSLSLTPLPPAFKGADGMSYFGGNLLCLTNPATPYPQSQFAFDDMCAQTHQFTLAATATSLVFALMASGATDVATVCTLQMSAGCISILAQAQTLGQSIGELPSTAWTPQATNAIPPIQFIQFAQTTANWVVLQQPLLTSDPHWSFYGWLAIFDWIEGRREVVSIEGDVSTVVVMSEVFPIYQLTMGSSSQSLSGPQILYSLVLYTSAIAVCIGVLVSVYTVREQNRINDMNFLNFNRVAMLVWIGRPFLFLRGLTAILLLGSPQTTLVAMANGYTKFVATRRSLWATFVVAGEATWILYCASDALVIVTRTHTRVAAPMSCAIAWLATVLLEATTPVMLTATLDRQCTTANAFENLYCQSGVVAVGSWGRILTLVLVDGVALVTGYIVASVWSTQMSSLKSRETEASLLLHGSAEAFLEWKDPTKDWNLDAVALAMTGLVPFKVGTRVYLFDIKLWLVYHDGYTALHHQVAQPSCIETFGLHTDSPTEEAPIAFRAKWIPKLTAVAGLIYILASCIGSVSYIVVSTVNFANDFYWASFNMTAHHIAIADWFNQQLWLGRTMSNVRLDDPKWSTMDVNYSDPTLQVVSSPWYGARLQFEALSDIRSSIQGLRRTDGCDAPWIFSQYCWVDFDRRWAMANSAARQTRCLQDASNGALYLEAVLRNIHWESFNRCWGTSFDAAFGNELKASTSGQIWLAQTLSNANTVDSEVAYWTTRNISSCVVQWQNFKYPGLINTYTIENAFGVGYSMTLSRSNGSYVIAAQTSYKMYWGLASDLWAISANTTLLGGRSLIRSSAAFAFTNTTMLSVLAQNMTLSLPLFDAFAIVERQIGPFGSIDMKNVPCPDSVKQLMAIGIDLIRTTNAESARAGSAYATIAHAILSSHFAMPSSLLEKQDWLALGGSLLCQDFGGSTLALGILQYTSRQNPCAQDISTLLEPSKTNVLVAAIASGLASSADINPTCVHDTTPLVCVDEYLGPSLAYLQMFVAARAVMSVAGMARLAAADVQTLQPSLMQYVRENKSQPLQLVTFPLLDPSDPTFAFWSWLYIFEWASCEREVVAFQGDVGFVNVMTEWTPPLHLQVLTNELPTTITTYALAGVLYITGVMLGVAGLVLLYIGCGTAAYEPKNMMKLNRVAGMVWIGRPLLLLRGVTALCLLSTATLELSTQDERFFFSVSSPPWYKTILGSGESGWLVYILNDLVLVWTQQYTSVYASASSSLVWFVATILTLAKPVVHHATIDPTCEIDHMDFQLVCRGGTVAIGQVTRLYWLLAIIGLCNVAGYGVARVYQRKTKPDTHHFPLLSAGATYLFHRTKWMHENVYFVDPASALLNGILTFRVGSTIYAMDIKVWRHFAFYASENVPRRLKSAIPLSDTNSHTAGTTLHCR
ncbi:Aste57867_22034 [Aphanomyces stellatus]|uniref:Aste57867_22034 protein n=1 Tax=Aphanomyces stellatus TaxID=120398 RepID=A0A485LJ71_9STRA|nr:hypothetical protein As57867_021965 [Aphanomyces stellatus]VFT98702.1 Aste57867_22034 [Aphanomyces stellatus]